MPAGAWRVRLSVLAGLALGVALTIGIAGLTRAGWRAAAEGYASLLRNPGALADVLPYFSAIALSAAGLAVAYRAGFITIGSEGCLLAGILAGYAVFQAMGSSPLTPLVAAVAAAVAGALLSLLVGLLRVYLSVNETLSSLMLNYVVLSLLNYLVSGPWSVGAFTKTRPLPPGLMYPVWVAASAAVAVAAVYELLLRYTRLGVAVDAAGLARKAAETYGASYRRVVIYVSLLAGASAGLAGALYLYTSLGSIYALNQSYGYGYIGILAAWLASLSPLLSLASSLLLSSLYSVNAALQLGGVESSFAWAMQAVIVLSTISLAQLARRKAER